jgi:glutamate dehydrogenase
MTDPYKERFSHLVTQIVDRLPTGTPELEREFVRLFFHKMPLMDLEHLDPARACAVACHSYGFFRQKEVALQIRILRPDQAPASAKDTKLIIEVHNDDMPFILDSLTAELNRQGFTFYETIHPVFYLKRNKDGSLKQVLEIDESGDLPSGAKAESFIHFELSAMPEGLDDQQLEADIRRVLASVELVVGDWKPMVAKTLDVAKRLSKVSKYFGPDEIEEARDFLDWLSQKNFVFLGYMEYDFYDRQGKECLSVLDHSELGIFKTADSDLKPQGLTSLPPEVLHFAREPHLIEVTKSNRKSTVHRPVLMDYIAVKRFDERGKVIGESRFLGLFTSTVYYQSADRIPYIRRKIARTLARANFDPMSYNGKSLKAILEFYPRDELFQISEEDLFRFSIGLISLEARPEIRLFARRDRFERFMSCMVYIPRERFTSYLRDQIRQILEHAFNGQMKAFYTQLSDSPLARVHLIIGTAPGAIPEFSVPELEARIAAITNQWGDALRKALTDSKGEEEAHRLAGVFQDAFPDSYINSHEIEQAVQDITKIQQCIAEGGLAVNLYQRKGEPDHRFHLKLYTYQGHKALSDMLPMLEHMGCKVVEMIPYPISPRWKQGEILVRDFMLELPENQSIQLSRVKSKVEETLIEVWSGRVADDAFNALILIAQLSWRQAEILRAYSQYLWQTGFVYSQQYIADALARHPQAARAIAEAFLLRFDPQAKTQEDDSKFRGQLVALDHYLDQVSNIAEDRIIRRFVDLIQATLRTNYFQVDTTGKSKSYLSLKFRSADVPDLPAPVPFAEIFVYSLRTEGIHLRGSDVARGGLRWSDRPEDFRTEVLGLVKAQMVKNAVIVPQGAKGGFIVKQPPLGGDRAAMQAEGIACYRTFLSGLLDITDNIKQGAIVPPVNVVRYDGDDPYLVVAADKGTATFSDIANGLAAEYDFWLGDAFASGGSAGYDHKQMGITARGGWVSVERHFREMGKDIETQDFTVMGIGDMSGDVFGNGMLLSRRIRLLGAFNHRHIFLDPNPDAEKSFKERERLFALPASQWSDYNLKLISKGGGIFTRDQKVIPLSKEVQTMLDTTEERVAPEILIQLMLKADVDLLWNGGIGTYAKASDETHDEVGDRTNNAVRVNASELRAKVIGEGGNLGFTQRARIEYAQNGGRINTDAIDNSAGVDCSDHEVNIKIALQSAMETGRLDLSGRNKLLEAMTEEVGELVLIDNHLQTQAISVAEHRGYALLDPLARMMDRLEQEGFLDRTVEFLPNRKQLAELRAKKHGLTRPELAVLMAYAKLALYRDLKDSQMVRDDYFIADLLRYFPEAMQHIYREDILSHRLRGEIVATIITNSVVNRAGIAFAQTMLEETGVHPCDLARAYVITRDAFNLRSLWAEIEAVHAVDLQAELFSATASFVERTALWFLNNLPQPIDIERTIADFAPGIQAFTESFESILSPSLQESYQHHIATYRECGVSDGLAKNVAALDVLSSACDVVSVARNSSLSVPVVGAIYFELGGQLRLGWLRQRAYALAPEDYWERLAVKTVIDDLYFQQRRLTATVLQTLCEGDQCAQSVERWRDLHKAQLARYFTFIDDLNTLEHIDLSMLVVALRQVESVCST